MLIWFTNTASPSVASLRYRALLPIAALEAGGVSSLVTNDPAAVRMDAAVEAIIFVKAFSGQALRLAWEADRRGIPVILDLCDNIFVPGYGNGFDGFELVARFRSMARLASAVVTTTEPMRELLVRELGPAVPVHISPDGIETREFVQSMLRRSDAATPVAAAPAAPPVITAGGEGTRRFLSRLAQAARNPGKAVRVASRSAVGRLVLLPLSPLALAWVAWKRSPRAASAAAPSATAEPPAPTPAVSMEAGLGSAVTAVAATAKERTVLWFGNAGTPYGDFGIPTLLGIEHALATVAREVPLRLLVVSNSREKYNEYVRPMLLTTKYLEWDALSIYDRIRKADVVVLPNSLDEFSVGKSANRAVLALSLGVPVIASAAPAMEPLREVAVLDDWVGGLRRYLLTPELGKRDGKRGRELVNRLYGQEAVRAAWLEVLAGVRTRDRRRHAAGRQRLAIFIDLIQDTDLALPIIERAAGDARFAVEVVLTRVLAARSPRSRQAVEALGLTPTIVERADVLAGRAPDIAGFDRLLTISETNLGPHRAARALTERAKAAGIPTFTLQHGMENVGLNYFEEHGPVDFASDRILTWGARSVVPGRTPADTAARCTTIGLVKPARPAAVPALPGPAELPCIGVFENLHWERYGDGFREAFLRDLLATAAALPRVRFVIKPHHAGRWLTGRFTGTLRPPSNLIFLDPKDPAWEPYTAPAIIAGCAGVITTPSTVALDAAIAGKPTAVATYAMDLPFYDPLPRLDGQAAWERFIAQALARDAAPLASARAFAAAVVAAGDGCARALDAIAAGLSRQAEGA